MANTRLPGYRVQLLSFAGFLCMTLASTAWGDVKVRTLADGSKMIFNETEADRSRRTAGRLVAVPRSDIASHIDRHARRWGLSPQLVQAVVQVESGYNPNAISNMGARGLMQLMPDTARELGVVDVFDPDENIRGGTTYLYRLLSRFAGDLHLALAGYNAGPGAVERYGGVPPYKETQNYVRKVLDLYQGTAPVALQEHARVLAKERRRQSETQRQAEQKPSSKPILVTRDANNQLVLTNTSSKSR